ncbi:MAG: hypothetical protein A2254_17385 [Ignavibacteria bacterium RIFOXYA2_FULL_35_9]|nr:MAG: hypothetical protein A2254_17385 [Ignavibacteria bacterium RIFOXYA2_FULL_35_9]
MKKLYLIIFVLFFSSLNFSQWGYPKQNNGMLTGGLGLNWIDGELFYSLNFNPEISFANFGVGLDLKLDIDSKGNLRKENFNEFSDYLSIIRYLRYGLKNDPVFIKLGALDYYTLGHGSIMYLYNNSPTYDVRKIGLVFDVDFGQFGFESIYSKFGEAGVAGLRGYVRPLKFSSAGDIPILGSLEVGVTYAGDFHENAGIISGTYDNVQRKINVTKDEGAISIFGVDLGLPIIQGSMANLTLYLDYANISGFGGGTATGAIFNFNPLGLVSGSVKLERRFNGDNYIPSYFNSFYELERFKLDTATGTFVSKAQLLAGNTNVGNGFYGELGVNVLGLFNILGSYQRLDKHPTSGILHLGTEIAPEGFPLLARTGYDKINIVDEKDLFKLDDRSYLFFELGYKPYPFMIVSMLYNWTFSPIRDKDDEVIDFKPQKRIEPRVYFVYPFSF